MIILQLLFFSCYSLILIPKIFFFFFFFFFFLVGDFATQALISSILYRAFPDDPIVGEEDASELRAESGKEMKDRIVELANEGLTYELELGDNRNWGIGPGEQQSDEQLLDAIDRGNYEGGRVGRKSSRCLLLLLQEKTLMIDDCRYVDHRPYRWNQRFSSWRTIRRLSLPYRRFDSASGRYRMPKSSCQPRKS